MITISSLAAEQGRKKLFSDVDLCLNAGSRYGVVGANGAGKSTFLNLISQNLTPSNGKIEYSKQLSIGYLRQDHFYLDEERVVDVVIRGNAVLWQALSEKEQILAKDDITDADGIRLALLEEQIALQGGYDAESVACTILSGLGILPAFHYGPLKALSGGYRLRVLLAQVLFQNPDIMLLDEPTNHLDIMSIVWLEDFLKKYAGLLLFVSHDRNFLNNVSTHILDVDYGTITSYTANYEKYLLMKEQVALQKEADLASKQRRIDEMQEFADRFRAVASKARQAQSRLRMIEKLSEDMPDIDVTIRRSPIFHFTATKALAKNVLNVETLKKSFGDKTIFNNISFFLRKGERVGIVGPNGIGKSTLLKILMNQLDSDAGQFVWHESVSIGYFPQDYYAYMDANMSVKDWLESVVPTVTEQQVRRVCGALLFQKDDVDKKIGVLSGGETARLYMGKFILQGCNVLVLDEPTNHLDLEAIDGLSEGLAEFAGTVLFVSHNRYFVDKVANRVLAINPKGKIENLHDYKELLAKNIYQHFRE